MSPDKVVPPVTPDSLGSCRVRHSHFSDILTSTHFPYTQCVCMHRGASFSCFRYFDVNTLPLHTVCLYASRCVILMFPTFRRQHTSPTHSVFICIGRFTLDRAPHSECYQPHWFNFDVSVIMIMAVVRKRKCGS